MTALAILATVLSALFFVSGKVLIARYGMPWWEVWRWALLSSGLCGVLAWLAFGMPTVSWQWCVLAGLSGSLAHIASYQALAWGEASLLVPVSGAKPLMLIPLMPLVLQQPMPPHLMHACVLATIGVALSGLSPRRRHLHAPHPTAAFFVMFAAAGLMALSDLCGAAAVDQAGARSRAGVISLWTACLVLLPAITLRHKHLRGPGGANRMRAGLLGVLFAVYVAILALAFASAGRPEVGVTTVNVIIAFRGVLGVVLVVACDRILGTKLEPMPGWVHAVRFAGALVIGVGVAVAYL